MNRSQRVSFRVFIGIEIASFILLGAGILTMCSPFWTPGGLFGWWEGYRQEHDVLGIVWLGGSIFSVLLGLVMAIVAAVVAIWIGIAAGIVGLARTRARGAQASDKGVAHGDSDDQVNPKTPPKEI